MVTFLPPNLSTTFLVVTIAPLIIGFLVGIIAKGMLKVGLAVAVLIGVLIVLGTVAPNQIIGPVASLIASGQAYVEKVKQISGYLPYASITFILGLLVGFFKG
ncbi:MAG: hypothetical protein LYZ69_03330 [Nitrososphaerales archaeon]|nr:hypothetical protein [Nitrososphaerales archaeon]